MYVCKHAASARTNVYIVRIHNARFGCTYTRYIIIAQLYISPPPALSFCGPLMVRNYNLKYISTNWLQVFLLISTTCNGISTCIATHVN